MNVSLYEKVYHKRWIESSPELVFNVAHGTTQKLQKNSGFAERTLSTDHSYDCYFTCPLSVNNFKSTYLKFIFIQLIHLVASGSK